MKSVLGSKTSFRRLSGDAASQIAEAALVLPLAFMILLGIYWFGRAFNIYATINHAAREAARVGVAQYCATCGNSNVPPATGTALIAQILQASSVDPSQIQLYTPTFTSCTGYHFNTSTSPAPNVTFRNFVQVTATAPNLNGGPQACGVEVSFQYPYQFWLPFTSLNMTQITLKADVRMKGEY